MVRKTFVQQVVQDGKFFRFLKGTSEKDIKKKARHYHATLKGKVFEYTEE